MLLQGVLKIQLEIFAQLYAIIGEGSSLNRISHKINIVERVNSHQKTFKVTHHSNLPNMPQIANANFSAHCISG